MPLPNASPNFCISPAAATFFALATFMLLVYPAHSKEEEIAGGGRSLKTGSCSIKLRGQIKVRDIPNSWVLTSVQPSESFNKLAFAHYIHRQNIQNMPNYKICTKKKF